jgi:hypothetical protein
MTFKKGNNKGVQFSSTYQPKKNGRKPSLFRKLKELTGKRVDYELSREDFYKTIRFLFERTQSELKKVYEDKETPVWVCNIIAAIWADTRYGRTTTIDTMFDRFFGKATQPIEADFSLPRNQEENMTDEAIKSEIERIDNELKK